MTIVRIGAAAAHHPIGRYPNPTFVPYYGSRLRRGKGRGGRGGTHATSERPSREKAR
jgi:hypothetical protein